MSDYTTTLLIVTGPTATGKTKLALELAKKYNGELISADSRQVYKYLNIGTGKDLPLDANFQLQARSNNLDFGFYDFEDIPVWGLDIVHPDYQFNVSDWVLYANRVVTDVLKRGKLPIIVGGTGQYLRSFINPPETLNVSINEELRNRLNRSSVTDLQKELSLIDVEKWEQMNDSDRQNPRRLIRAIEVAANRGEEKTKQSTLPKNRIFSKYVVIGLSASREEINKRIDSRVNTRVKQGIITEIATLLKREYSWDLPSLSATGYREFKDYFKNGRETELEACINRWKIDEHQYAKRQLTYLKKYLETARWFDVGSQGYKEEICDYLKQTKLFP